MNNQPFVTVIMPCFNENNYIGKCLDSVIVNDYPQNKLEVLVIDGMSKDGTQEILKEYAQRYPFIKILYNSEKITPTALNIGIRNAKGEIVVRMDAHSTYECDYISKCVKYLKEYNADNVGGIWITVPRNDSLFGKAIALSLSHYFGVGNAYYRIGKTKKPILVDTVPYGCFRRDVFNRIGYFDETSPRNEDIEFNSRLRKKGGKILLVPEIKIKYYARSTFFEFVKHNFDNGLKVAFSFMKLRGILFSLRHQIPLIFLLSIISTGLLALFSPLFLWLLGFIICSYALANFYFSTQVAIDKKDIRLLFLMPIVFASLHFSYGLGSIWGGVKLLLPDKKGNSKC